jgi:ribose transport system substrate-binding protein
VRRVSRVVAVAALFAMAVLTGCGSSKKDDSGSAASTGSGATPAKVQGGKSTLGVVAIDLQNSFFVRMKQAGDQAAKDYGVKATWQSAEGSLEKQVSIIENMVRQKVGAILLDPVDKNAVKPAIAKATAAGIPVITMGNKVNADGNYNTLYPDAANMAMVARALGASIGGSGQVGLLVGARGNWVSDGRQQAFVDTMKKEYPNVKVVSVQPTDWDAAKATDVVNTWLTTYPDLKGIGCFADSVCVAAKAAADASGKQLKFGSHDGDEEMLPAVEDGSDVLDVLTGAGRVGYWNIAVAARLTKGEKLPHDLFLPTFFITTDKSKADLAGKGVKLDNAITPEQARKESGAFGEQFGPDKPESAMTVGQSPS